MSNATPDIIRKLIDRYPNAAAMPDTPEHQLPLHIAVSHNASVEVLQVLYEAYPDAIKCHTKTRGFIPLHMACLHKDTSPGIVHFLLEKYKDGAMVSLTSSDFLYLALGRIYRFSHAMAVSLQVRAKQCESLPLHLAARYGCPIDVIHMLVDAYPKGLGEINHYGETPFTSTFSYEVRLCGYMCEINVCQIKQFIAYFSVVPRWPKT